jgi:hypothetical protein
MIITNRYSRTFGHDPKESHSKLQSDILSPLIPALKRLSYKKPNKCRVMNPLFEGQPSKSL